ncbi:hypothetical protein NADFUDRAFT_82439 [Nadsonia fulvescens var. elongata DSM 6958]|uniref:Non-structural maintenance of chromosomes element 1 homolog n=1 Tax=Nadsonia fulvescens var. elongata DSM 6958 TaxID=857566 RepID=A0A1E3PMN4_9ASCO|nr:hypothetical protein NADFUDRAFT_82439 [Nadsonia fulvescens var. elongata DSM 6958]
MIHRTVTLTEATDILSKIVDAYGTPSNEGVEDVWVKSVFKQINENLYVNDLDIKLQWSLDQRTGKDRWTLVNTCSDEISQYATLLSPDEIKGFRNIIREIFRSAYLAKEDYSLPELYGIEEPKAKQLCRGGTKSGQAVIDQLLSTGWLHMSETRYISLSERTIIELKDYLIREFGSQPGETETSEYSGSLSTCAGCKEIVTFGQRCSNPQVNCNIRLHYHCTSPFFATLIDPRTCPGCSIAHGEVFTPIGC